MRFREFSSESFSSPVARSEGAAKDETKLTNDELQAFAEEIKERYGLHHFSLSMPNGAIRLGMIWVRDNPGSGIGTKAMNDLCAFADQHGARISLTPNAKDEMFGTTSYARLVKFYKRFGFKENRGRSKDFRISDAMIREPKGAISEDRIDELSRPPDLKDAGAVLTAAGYEQQKANDAPGAFGSVWRKPGAPYVLKIFSSSDYAYEAFVKLAMAHQDNPHFPKLFGKMIRVTPLYFGIRMEPLEPYKYDSTLIRRYTKYRDYVQNNKDLDPNSIVAMEYEDCLEFLYEYPKLKEALDLIIDGLLGTYGNDISNKNIMLRGKTIVITDPVAGFV